MEIKQTHIEQWKKIRSQPLKAQIQYFLTYYKWSTIAILVVLAFAGYYIATIVSAPDEELNGILLNASNYSNIDALPGQVDYLQTSFRDYVSLNEEQLEIKLDTSRTYSIGHNDLTANYEVLQVLLVNIAADNLDFMIGDETLLIDFAYREMFQNLEDVMPEELLHTLSENLLYIDLAVIREKENGNTDIVYPDCTDPDAMEEPIPVLVRISNCAKLKDIYGNQCDTLSFSFAGNENYDRALEFLEFIRNPD